MKIVPTERRLATLALISGILCFGLSIWLLGWLFASFELYFQGYTTVGVVKSIHEENRTVGAGGIELTVPVEVATIEFLDRNEKIDMFLKTLTESDVWHERSSVFLTCSDSTPTYCVTHNLPIAIVTLFVGIIAVFAQGVIFIRLAKNHHQTRLLFQN